MEPYYSQSLFAFINAFALSHGLVFFSFLPRETKDIIK